MSYRYIQKDITSINKLLEILKQDESRISKDWKLTPKIWFRGLRKFSNSNVPTFIRDGYRNNDEIYMMNLFKQNSHELLNIIPSSEWEWMFLMRHHNLPSRLLDWTENPLIGLYFAVRPRVNNEPETDGVLWCMLPSLLNHWSIGWPIDNVSLPMFTENETEYTIGDNETLNLYLPSSMRMLTGEDIRPPAAGICIRTNKRIQAQMGVFTVHHIDSTPVESVRDSSHIWRYKIPKDSKPSILDDLRRIGVTNRTVFPDLDNVAIEASKSLGAIE